MASVAKRPDGRWRARYRDPAGKEHSKHFERKIDAQRWLTTVESEKLRGTYIDPKAGRVTVAEYAQQWLDVQPLRPSSRRTYGIYLRTRIVPVLGARPLASVRPSDVHAFLRTLDALAPNTVRGIHSILSAVFTSAVDDGLIAKSPCVRTTPPKPQRPKVDPLTVDQVQALLEAVPDRYRGCVALGAFCGLRLGEVLGLKVGRVRFLQRELDVVEQLTLVPGAPPSLGPPKTRSSVRTVPMPQLAVDALSLHLAEWPAGPADLVFRSRTSGVVWPNTFQGSVWRPAVQRAGLPTGTRFHDLRHFLASLLIASGESVKTVQAVLGHASAVETLETYSHLWPDSEQRTRAAVDGAFAPRADYLRTERGPRAL